MTGDIKTVSHHMLDFCLVYPELCQSLLLYLGGGGGGGTDHFERLGGGMGLQV